MKRILTVVVTLLVVAFMSSCNKERVILISTDYGDMKVKLYNETPKHRDNMVKLVEEEFYDGTLFHRIIESFMIQGGDPDSKNALQGQKLGNGGPGYTIEAEFNAGLFHKKGAIAAARLGDSVNPDKESSGSQFYIVQGKIYTKEELNTMKARFPKITDERIEAYSTVGGTPHLDDNYTVFGEIIEGLDVIDKIADVQKDSSDRPLENVKMTISIVK